MQVMVLKKNNNLDLRYHIILRNHGYLVIFYVNELENIYDLYVLYGLQEKNNMICIYVDIIITWILIGYQYVHMAYLMMIMNVMSGGAGCGDHEAPTSTRGGGHCTAVREAYSWQAVLGTPVGRGGQHLLRLSSRRS